jgi:hypothetical protein
MVIELKKNPLVCNTQSEEENVHDKFVVIEIPTGQKKHAV